MKQGIGGRKPAKDKKLPLTIYVPQSKIEKQGKDALRDKMLKSVGE